MCQGAFKCLLLLQLGTLLLKVCVAESGYDDTIRCEEFPEVANFTVEQIEAELLQHGSCVPFSANESETVCGRFYETGVDTIYVPDGRSLNTLNRLVAEASSGLSVVRDECVDPATRTLCYYYYPPCGNITHFQPPNAICQDTCLTVSTVICPIEWDLATTIINGRAAQLNADQLQFIECDNPGVFFETIPHCCSNAGVLENVAIETPVAASNVTMMTTESRSDDTVVIAASVTANFVFLLIIACIVVTAVLCAVRRKARMKRLETDPPPQFMNYTRVTSPGPETAPRYELVSSNSHVLNVPEVRETRIRANSADIREMSELKLLIPSRHLKLLDTIGQGEFGVVYRGHLTGWERRTTAELVAVKTLKNVHSTKDIEDLMKESKKMQRFQHSNVLNLIGVCIDSGEAPYIIMPYMANGSLLTYLRKERPQLTIAEEAGEDPIADAQRKLLSICLQIAKGMCYLAQQKFVHRDLAARNCMIDKNLTIKVADFGLSEDIYCRNYFKQGQVSEKGATVKLPIRWMALESLLDSIFTEKTDVWSYGVTCWEVFSLGHTPYPAVDPFALVKFLRDGNRLDKPSNAACTQQVYELIGLCWTESPDKRPSFQELVERVNSLLESVAGYLDFSAFPSESYIDQGYDHLEEVIQSN